ncbi:hypothetical protein PIIN_09974 [Serendipita indica DSM 11827]|uniref:Uncharacterized protein n=1 Tax=Serendipita indica (strain DSM 11827) TaxID=1109443 RepID=G4TXD1_SERID|nr:hypothetical protein PIIN_09974 [Serendipita indica DSM 11827]
MPLSTKSQCDESQDLLIISNDINLQLPSKDTRTAANRIDRQFGPENQDCERKLVEVAAWLLREEHIDVVNPSQILHDFPANTCTLDHDKLAKLRQSFLDQLSSIQQDQQRRANATKVKTTPASTDGDESPKEENASGSKKSSQGMKETAMYLPLIAAFNAVLNLSESNEPRSLRYFDIGSKHQKTHASGLTMSPDLALTFDYDPGKAFDEKELFARATVCVEVKRSHLFDIPFVLNNSQGSVLRGDLLKLPKQLLLQVIRYVHMAQAPVLPWDYIHFITMTDPLHEYGSLRLANFVYALSRNGRRGMGLCVGPDGPFKDVDFSVETSKDANYTDQLHKKLDRVADVYAKQSKNVVWKRNWLLDGI